jgi:hypothetical protein
MPLRTNANKQLVTGLIGPADISFAVLSNPLYADLEVLGEVVAENVVSGGLDLNQFATVGSDLLDVTNKTTNLTFFGGRTTVAGILLAPDILAHSILDSATGSELLNIDADSVDVYSQQFTFNGDDIATESTVDAAIAAAIAGLQPGDNTKVQNLTAVPGTSTFAGLVEADDLSVGTHGSVEVTLVSLESKTLNLSATTLSTSIEGSLTLRGATSSISRFWGCLEIRVTLGTQPPRGGHLRPPSRWRFEL